MLFPGKAVEEMDWLLPTDVQAEAIPLILGGGDVLMAAGMRRLRAVAVDRSGP